MYVLAALPIYTLTEITVTYNTKGSTKDQMSCSHITALIYIPLTGLFPVCNLYLYINEAFCQACALIYLTQ